MKPNTEMRSLATPCAGTLALLAGCTAVPPRPVPARLVVVPSNRLLIRSVAADEGGSSIRVTGRVSRRTMIPGPIWGHLHIEALGPDGPVVWTDARWSQLSQRRLPTSAFSADLRVTSAQVDEIRISHAPAHPRACQSGTSQ